MSFNSAAAGRTLFKSFLVGSFFLITMLTATPQATATELADDPAPGLNSGIQALVGTGSGGTPESAADEAQADAEAQVQSLRDAGKIVIVLNAEVTSLFPEWHAEYTIYALVL